MEPSALQSFTEKEVVPALEQLTFPSHHLMRLFTVVHPDPGLVPEQSLEPQDWS